MDADQTAVYLADQIVTLTGAKVVAVNVSDCRVGIVFELPAGDCVVAWISSDAEGNGPGWIEIEPRPQPRRSK